MLCAVFSPFWQGPAIQSQTMAMVRLQVYKMLILYSMLFFQYYDRCRYSGNVRYIYLLFDLILTSIFYHPGQQMLKIKLLQYLQCMCISDVADLW